jgi:hypothetical protein
MKLKQRERIIVEPGFVEIEHQVENGLCIIAAAFEKYGGVSG